MRWWQRGNGSRKGPEVGKYRIYPGHGEWNQFIQRRGLGEWRSLGLLKLNEVMRYRALNAKLRSIKFGGSRIAWSKWLQEDEWVGDVGAAVIDGNRKGLAPLRSVALVQLGSLRGECWIGERVLEAIMLPYTPSPTQTL